MSKPRDSVSIPSHCIPYLLESAFTKSLAEPLSISRAICDVLFQLPDDVLIKLELSIMSNALTNPDINIIDMLTFDNLYDKIQFEKGRRLHGRV